MIVRRSRDELLLYPSILLFYRSHPILAAMDLLGLQLPPHQRLDLKIMWHSGAKNFIRLFGRGMSKTTTAAIFVVLKSMLYPRLRSLPLGGGGFRQGKLILEQCQSIIKGELDGQASRGFALNMIDIGSKKSFSNIIHKDPDMWYIRFTNGSQIATAPIGQKGDAIRGFRANISLIDERKDMKKEIRDKVVKPFSIIDYNVITQSGEFANMNIDSGTLEYEEDDYTQEYYVYLKKVAEGDPDYMVIKFVYADAYDVSYSDDYKYDSKVFGHKMKFWSIPFGILVNDIEAETDKSTTDYESWRSEHLCVPQRATGDFYQFQTVQKASKRLMITDDEYIGLSEGSDVYQYLSPQKEFYSDPCVLGIDVARENDLNAFVVIRVGSMATGKWDATTQSGKTDFDNVIWAHQQPNMHDPDTAVMIYDILSRFNIVRIAMDKRGGGTGVRDQLYHVVKDGKVDAPILYDPNDDGNNGIATLVRNEDVPTNPNLRLVTYDDKMNTMVNRAVRTAMESGSLSFAGGDDWHGDPELDNIQRSISAIISQFRLIRTRQTRNNWLNFYTDNPKKMHKDLYSATIYAYGEILNLIYENSKTGDAFIDPTVAPVINFKM